MAPVSNRYSFSTHILLALLFDRPQSTFSSSLSPSNGSCVRSNVLAQEPFVKLVAFSSHPPSLPGEVRGLSTARFSSREHYIPAGVPYQVLGGTNRRKCLGPLWNHLCLGRCPHCGCGGCPGAPCCPLKATSVELLPSRLQFRWSSFPIPGSRSREALTQSAGLNAEIAHLEQRQSPKIGGLVLAVAVTGRPGRSRCQAEPVRYVFFWVLSCTFVQNCGELGLSAPTRPRPCYQPDRPAVRGAAQRCLCAL